MYIYMHTCNILAGITVKFCAENNINVTKYMLNNTYCNKVKYRLKSHLWGTYGVVDSILNLINYSKRNRRV